MITALLLASAQISPSAGTLPEDPNSDGEILVTASLLPVHSSNAPASTTFFDEDLIDALGLTAASDLVRLAPGVSVATSGARGTETVVRIRGAESHHTLVFIDGIAFNDVAAANAARFDTFSAGGLDRIELIRGPQSALWGSEALGGVVALTSPDPLGRRRAEAAFETGSGDFHRADAEFATGGQRAGLSATASWARGDGIDIIGGGTGDRDGFETLTLGLKGVGRFGAFEAGAVGRKINHEIDFDGVDPFTFRRADTRDSSVADTAAVRGWVGFDDGSGWSARLEAQHLDSENRNRVGAVRTTDSRGRRTRFGGRVGRRLEAAGARHDLVMAVEREEEKFTTADAGGNGPGRSLDRARTAFVAEWRAIWGDRVTTDLAVRHDDFDRFVDDTTVRLNAVVEMGDGLQLLAGYGEGIAQPSFTDLFGFPGFPFVGNSDLRPERSRGFEAGLRWRDRALTLEAVLFSNDLEDEIVEDFSVFPSSVVNASGKSRRRGLELAAIWQPTASLRLNLNYTRLDSREGDAGDSAREIRRPRNTANVFADWRSGPYTIGASFAYVGRRTDRDFDLFPAPTVTLDDYLLGGLRLAYRLLPQVEAFARVENGFDADYQDVFGYGQPGRSVHAGLRVALGR